MKRRDFLATLAAGGYLVSKAHAHTPFPVKFRRPPPYSGALAFVEPGLDEFRGEQTAIEIETRLREALLGGRLPVATGCGGLSPAVREYQNIGPGRRERNRFEQGDVAAGCRKWRESLGSISAARFYSLPGDLVRYEVRSRNAGRLEYRVGFWKLSWRNGAITRLEPVEEILTHADKPWFRDVTGGAFAGEPSFHEQLARGISYWRACLDPACGMDSLRRDRHRRRRY